MTNRTENKEMELATFIDLLMDELSLVSDERVIADAIKILDR